MTLRDVLLDPSVFPKPLEFLPDRWLANTSNFDSMNRSYVPFGRGSRMCIGLKYETPFLEALLVDAA